MFFAGRFTLSQSSRPVRSAKYLRTFFVEFVCLSRDFVNQHVFLPLDLHWDSPKLPWGIQRICGPIVLKTIIMPFNRLFVLWHSLTRSLYFIQVYIFIPLINSASFFRAFHTSYFTPFFFSYVYYHAKYFSYPCWRCCSEFNYYFKFHSVEGLIWTVFFFLTYTRM